MIVMKAMGMESDQEVVQMVGRDPQFSVLLLPSIEVSNMVKDLKSAMNFLVASLRYSPRNLTNNRKKYDHKYDHVRTIWDLAIRTAFIIRSIAMKFILHILIT